MFGLQMSGTTVYFKAPAGWDLWRLIGVRRAENVHVNLCFLTSDSLSIPPCCSWEVQFAKPRACLSCFRRAMVRKDVSWQEDLCFMKFFIDDLYQQQIFWRLKVQPQCVFNCFNGVLQMLHKLCLPEFDISRLFVEHTSILQFFFFFSTDKLYVSPFYCFF